MLGNASLDESAKVPRQPQRKRPPPSLATEAGTDNVKANARKLKAPATTTAPPAICGKYRITGTMRKGATGYLYSAVPAVRDGEEDKGAVGVGSGGGEVVLKVEECAAPKRQMQNEWEVSL